MELPEGAYYKVNIYGIDIGDGIVLIDCGDEDYVKNLYKSVRKAFKKPVIAVYLTHGHADHAGGGAYFQRKGVPVYSHSYEVPLIESGAYDPSVPDQFTYTGFTPDYLYAYAEEEEGFTIEYTPGHTMGSSSLIVEGKYAFVGDLLSTGGKPHVQRLFAEDWSSIQESINRVKSAQPEWIYSGHGKKPISYQELISLEVE